MASASVFGNGSDAGRFAPQPPPPVTHRRRLFQSPSDGVSLFQSPYASPPPSSSSSSALQHRRRTGMAPYAHVDSSLRTLAGQAEGFGRSAVGGLHGALYRVTTLADDGTGSLREGCRRREPLWIVFEISGTIHLSTPVTVSSYKTIDGRGQRIKLTGKGMQLQQCEHAIICNLEFESGRGRDADAIQIKLKSRHIWIDRCSLRDYDDGLIDITLGSTDITISRCHFSMHNKTMLIGADCTNCDVDRSVRVTVHHCFFDGTKQRHPRVRFGKVHLYNNYTRGWGIYAVCAGLESQILSQCNIYEAGTNKTVFKYAIEKAPDGEVEMSGSVRSEGDLFLEGAEPRRRRLPGPAESTESECVFEADEFYPAGSMEPASEALKQLLLRSGWQATTCRPPETSSHHGDS